MVTAISFQLLDRIVKKQLKIIEWAEEEGSRFLDLQRIMDRMLQDHFDRNFESLKLLREGLNSN